MILPWPWGRLILPAISPYVAICSAISVRSISVVTLIGLPLLIPIIARRRWFCRNACPMGLLAEQAGRLHWWGSRRPVRLPPLGQWIALVTLAGACLGYPLLLWLDPLAMFTAPANLFGQSAEIARLAAGIGLPLVLLISFLWPNTWCRRLCPLGATQDLLALSRWLGRGATAGLSSSAGHKPCEDTAGQASSGTQSAGKGPSRRPFSRPLPRRSVLALCLGAAWAAMARQWSGGKESRPLRPPGAVDEARFAGLCVRCGNCIRACPTGIIRPDLEHGIAGLYAPVIEFEEGYCREDCRQCTQVCPSGAIQLLTLEQKRHARLGLARLDPEVCVVAAEDAECSACLSACPYEAIKIVFNEEDYTSTPLIDSAKCPGCGACQVACPTVPKAIVVAT